MRNRRGVFLPLYLVVLTIVMCTAVVGLYFIEQQNAMNSLVSPSSVLELRDKLEVYEMREAELIKSSLESAKFAGEFGSDEFEVEFRRIFLEGVWGSSEMMNFIKKDPLPTRLVINNKYLENIYHESLTDLDGGFFGRRDMKKGRLLKAKGRKGKIFFDVDFSYEFDRTYKVSYDKSKFVVEARD